jgi:hypothetical protein
VQVSIHLLILSALSTELATQLFIDFVCDSVEGVNTLGLTIQVVLKAWHFRIQKLLVYLVK